MKVLLVEDDAASAVLIEVLLAKWGYRVTVAADGDRALEVLLGPDAPRLVVLDRGLPGKSGDQVCRELRARAMTDPPFILMLTGQSGKDDLVSSLEAGANDYVSKPFNHAELRARLQVGARVLELQASLADRIQKLEEALAHIKRLEGILPICMHCHKIRHDRAGWERLEKYIAEHSEARFSHSLCPDCMKLHYPEYLNQE
jgi:DNA-binding response OmpR family regulator